VLHCRTEVPAHASLGAACDGCIPQRNAHNVQRQVRNLREGRFVGNERENGWVGGAAKRGTERRRKE
jgi:hypothetical protein